MSANHTQINHLLKEIANLRKADAHEAKKESDLVAKLNRSGEAANRTTSSSTYRSKMKECERASRDLAAVEKKRADIAGKIADKSKRLQSCQQTQLRDEEKARRRVAEEQKRLIREREAHERRVTKEVRSRKIQPETIALRKAQEDYDFFISHASEDKEGFVRELAETLRGKGVRVWYDEFTLKVGDSLRRNIDRGLAASRFGIVVLSEHFFRKEWTNRELDGLVAREVQGEARILPIWHKVSKDEVARYSPTLADKIALNSSLKSIDEIADQLIGLTS